MRSSKRRDRYRRRYPLIITRDTSRAKCSSLCSADLEVQERYTWAPVSSVPPTINGYQYTWTVNKSDLTSPAPEATEQAVVMEGDGYAPTAYTDVLTFAP